MTSRKSISNVAAKLTVCVLVAGGLVLVGCSKETIEIPAEKKADQQKYLSQDVNQGSRRTKQESPLVATDQNQDYQAIDKEGRRGASE